MRMECPTIVTLMRVLVRCPLCRTIRVTSLAAPRQTMVSLWNPCLATQMSTGLWIRCLLSLTGRNPSLPLIILSIKTTVAKHRQAHKGPCATTTSSLCKSRLRMTHNMKSIWMKLMTNILTRLLAANKRKTFSTQTSRCKSSSNPMMVGLPLQYRINPFPCPCLAYRLSR